MQDNNPCIITVAITGSVPKKIDNPTVPISVSEQIESTRKSYDAGHHRFTFMYVMKNRVLPLIPTNLKNY